MAVYVPHMIGPKRKTAAVGLPCPYCGRAMKKRPNAGYVRDSWLNRCGTREHVVPRHMGVTNVQHRNVIIVCHGCNGLKGGMSPEEWVTWVTENRPWWLERVTAAIAATGYKLEHQNDKSDRASFEDHRGCPEFVHAS